MEGEEPPSPARDFALEEQRLLEEAREALAAKSGNGGRGRGRRIDYEDADRAAGDPG